MNALEVRDKTKFSLMTNAGGDAILMVAGAD